MGILYTVTILLNALLLFLVQPMIAKMLLPYLGGTPSVWNTCMVFFQALLLGGYAYAHFTTKWLSARQQILLHLILLSGAALVFPVQISDAAINALDAGARPVWWLLGQLLVTVGLPFFMLSTGGPLLQHWFSKTSHTAAHDPYFLYAASNLGSLVALIGYPLLLEPSLRLRQQGWLWASGYALVVAMIAACALARWTSIHPADERAKPDERLLVMDDSLTIRRRLWWVGLAFVPSSLLLGVTTYLSTDISPIPLLWVGPLAIYLLTFILAFAKRQFLPPRIVARLLPLLGMFLIFPILIELHRPIWLMIPWHLLFFFLAALVCHGQLAKDRPPARHLTEFYLWLSFGGVLGGLFNSLIAPNIFKTVVEYPLAIVLALMLCPRRPDDKQAANTPIDGLRLRWLDLGLPVALGMLTLALAIYLPHFGLNRVRVAIVALGIPALIGYAFVGRPVRFALIIGAMMLAGSPYLGEYGKTLHIERNFFGVLRVSEDKDGLFRQAFHGNTLHGRQFLDPQRQCEPLSYYHRQGPLGQALQAFTLIPAAHVAVIGLGTGTMACYAAPGQDWTFYEIDPAVLFMARDSGYFTYLTKCAASPVNTILGDARLQLRHAPDKHYGLIVLDAFSSDAIPAHLLTRQAFELYLSKLADGGRLVLHVSNQYLDLPPVVGDLAASVNLVGRINILSTSAREAEADAEKGISPSQWIALARRTEDLGSLATDPHWKPLDGRPNADVWMDDYSNILNTIRWK
jgi:hypothetical protein